jgi:hypothetical protein
MIEDLDSDEWVTQAIRPPAILLPIRRPLWQTLCILR